MSSHMEKRENVLVPDLLKFLFILFYFPKFSTISAMFTDRERALLSK